MSPYFLSFPLLSSEKFSLCPFWNKGKRIKKKKVKPRHAGRLTMLAPRDNRGLCGRDSTVPFFFIPLLFFSLWRCFFEDAVRCKTMRLPFFFFVFMRLRAVFSNSLTRGVLMNLQKNGFLFLKLRKTRLPRSKYFAQWRLEGENLLQKAGEN